MAVTDRERKVYLQGTEGPYRGRVVDARTKEPIRGAVVVAVWYHDVFALVQTNEQFYDAIEVLTDDQGYFVVDASEIEQHAPSRTKFPVFTIFKPGYSYFGGWLAPLEDLPQRQNKSLLRVVALDPVDAKSKRERLRDLPLRDTRVPSEKTPKFLKAVQEERNRLLR